MTHILCIEECESLLQVVNSFYPKIQTEKTPRRKFGSYFCRFGVMSFNLFQSLKHILAENTPNHKLLINGQSLVLPFRISIICSTMYLILKKGTKMDNFNCQQLTMYMCILTVYLIRFNTLCTTDFHSKP